MHETVQELGGQAGVGDQRSFFALMERRRCGQEHGRSREGAEAQLNGSGPVAWGQTVGLSLHRPSPRYEGNRKRRNLRQTCSAQRRLVSCR
jgi:hypothetical protein